VHNSIKNVPDDPAAILNALQNVPARFAPSLHFGEGDSADRFMDILHDDALWRTPKQKQFHDLLASDNF
jgi:UDP-N-acetylglucosamine 2-epimerase (hydrolysing)